jgi:uncharacterized repeat protein (TIGR01451 family)
VRVGLQSNAAPTNPPDGKDATMLRRWFNAVNGLVLSAILAATALGQASQQPTSLAERMAALRRGWSGTQNAGTQQHGISPQSTRAPQEESPSIWSNLLGRRAGPPPSRNNAHPMMANPSMQQGGSRMTAAGNPATGNVVPQARPTAPQGGNAASIRYRTDNFTLPGLGGSRLPQASATGSASAPAAGFNVSTQPAATQRPAAAVPPAQRITNPYVADRRATSTPAKPAARSSPRQSPVQRPAPQVDPEVLRRELAGSYPPASSTEEPVARTARATDMPAADETQPDVTPIAEPIATTDEPTTIETAPTISEQSPTNTATATDATPSIEAKSDSSPESEVAAPQTAAPASDASADFSAAFGSDFPVRSPRAKAADNGRPLTRSQEAFGESDHPTNNDPSVLASNETPVITSDIRGPKQITIGREASYRLQLQNQSDIAADGIVATIRIPTWAEVVDTSASQGMIQQPRGAAGPGQLEWQLSRLEGRAGETLDIKLIPRASRPLELGVSWTLSPVGSRAVVQVQEPKIQMSVSGPDEVLFSEPQLFRLMLSNPGTGVAEKVKIELIPPGSTQGASTSHVLGDLAPGASKTVEVELTAREAGKLFVKAVATAEGGLSAEAAKEIFCRKPELEVDWRGPETKYAGTPATYFLRVRNPGTAPADDVTLTVTLPEGAEFVSASEGQLYDDDTREVSWQVGTLGPGDDNYMELKCLVNTPGVNQLRISAAAATGDLADEKLAETNVVALADLKLQVSDPSGPVAVGEQAVYEIRVQNRGANTANEVNVVALFSDGIEPDQVEGAMYTVDDGRVTFRTIEELPAGREIVLRIRARAAQAGTHVFRAEVLCRDLEIKLAAEETTRFYAEDVLPEGGHTISDQTSVITDGFQSSGQ